MKGTNKCGHNPKDIQYDAETMRGFSVVAAFLILSFGQAVTSSTVLAEGQIWSVTTDDGTFVLTSRVGAKEQNSRGFYFGNSSGTDEESFHSGLFNGKVDQNTISLVKHEEESGDLKTYTCTIYKPSAKIGVAQKGLYRVIHILNTEQGSKIMASGKDEDFKRFQQTGNLMGQRTCTLTRTK
ncbi:hypothetical protein GO986_08560 [Deinococcus sp. HMF7620]|uniref:Uncharacterized protein n=1 Tax=Deinococcus arboris TaxID=2682977 RepID=A0A7C9HRG0_9DEIO|nr:hypothetical protein [Deinococcus arboris]MVN86813.1 hypothetical protein [Deinococcus arboris]